MIDACPKCGYSLDGLPDVHTCPECGLRYDRDAVVFSHVHRLLEDAPLLFALIMVVAVFGMWLWSGRVSWQSLVVLAPGLVWGFLETRGFVMVSKSEVRVVDKKGTEHSVAMDGIVRAKLSFYSARILLLGKDGRCRYAIRYGVLSSNKQAKHVVKLINEYVAGSEDAGEELDR